MKHDWEAFGNEIATLIKTRGNRGNRGCHHSNLLEHKDFVVTPHGGSRLPLEIEGLPDFATRGNHKTADLQEVTRRATPATPVTPYFQQGRTLDDDAPAPAEWHAILAELERRDPVEWLSGDRWSDLLTDTENFLSRWGHAAHQLGWTALDLFGVHPAAPAARFDIMGLILLIHGGAVVALTDSAASIRRRSNAVLTYRRQNHSDAILIWEAK